MRIVFLCNFLNHHQLEFCQAMVKLTNHNFYFIATEEVPKSFIDFGYANMNEMYDFVINMYKNKDEAVNIIESADVLIIGTNSYMNFKSPRLKNLKSNLFIYSERYFKKSGIISYIKYFLFAKKYLKPLSENDNVKFLCASAYLIEDCNKWNHFNDVFYRWGYFPPFIEENDHNKLWLKKKDKTILWCGRFIKLKHPEFAISLICRLLAIDKNYRLIMIGDGPLLENIKRYSKRKGVDKHIVFTGSMKAEEVRKYMKETQFFIMSSGRQEGWGAVINEAMNSGCISLVRKEMGCAPFLIKNNVNGFTYSNIRNCVEIITSLNETEKKHISLEAYKTISNEWNAEVAAKRFLDICSSKTSIKYESGPCSLMRYAK